MVQTVEGWIFPYGLIIIEELGKIVAFEMPNICKMMDWYRTATDNIEHFKFSDYGICIVNALYDIYRS